MGDLNVRKIRSDRWDEYHSFGDTLKSQLKMKKCWDKPLLLDGN